MNVQTTSKTYLALIVSLAVLFSVSEAVAVTTVTTCGQNIPSGTAAILGANLTYTGSQSCLQLPNGVDLNTSSYTITCGAGCTGQAIECATGGSLNTIQSTINNDTLTNITGPFSVAVRNCGTVKNLKIVGATTAIKYDHSSTTGTDYSGNVIEVGTGGTGISVRLEESGDSVRDNRITGGNYGINLLRGRTQNTAPYVGENIIRGFATAGIVSTNTTEDYVRITKNTMVNGLSGSVPMEIDGTHGTYADNICEDEGPVDNNRCACEVDKWDLTTVGNCPL